MNTLNFNDNLLIIILINKLLIKMNLFIETMGFYRTAKSNKVYNTSACIVYPYIFLLLTCFEKHVYLFFLWNCSEFIILFSPLKFSAMEILMMCKISVNFEF